MAKRNAMREKMKASLGDKTKESYSRRDEGSGGISNYFNNEIMQERGVKTWWAGKGQHIIDIIPYMAGPNDPKNKEGDPCYVLEIDVHRFVGPREEMIVCPEQFNKNCPICEEARKLNRAGADWKKVIKPLKPSKRVVYNVIVRDGGDMEKKGVQVFEISHWLMEKHLAKISKNVRGEGFTVFSDPDEGKSVCFERTGTGAENTNYDGYQFVERDYIISDEELEAAYCLDELLELKDYDEIYEIFFNTSEGSKEPKDKDAPPKRQPKASQNDEKDEEANDGDDENDGDEGDGPEVGEGPEVGGDEPEPPADEPEPPAEPSAAEKRRLARRSSKKEESSGPTCPHGGTIGSDIDELPECDTCKIYNQCADIADGVA